MTEPAVALLVILAYMAPFLVSIARGLDAPFVFLFANLFGGATVLGWFLVLYAALTATAPGTSAPRRERPQGFGAQPAIHITHFDRATLIAPVFMMPRPPLPPQPRAAHAAAPMLRARADDRWHRSA